MVYMGREIADIICKDMSCHVFCFRKDEREGRHSCTQVEVREGRQWSTDGVLTKGFLVDDLIARQTKEDRVSVGTS